MNYTLRRALPKDISPALDLALRVFIEFQMPYNDPVALENFKRDCIYNDTFIEQFHSGDRFMFVALDEEKIIGLINERGNGHIPMLYVDGEYHRRGIATLLMNQMIEALMAQGIKRITLNASPCGLPFYKHFGFNPTDTVQNKIGFVVTPMEYIFN
jgi:ribosomal protein S18 acetylase RimI-like enzyme